MVLIIWTREALQDVDDIATFISRDSVCGMQNNSSTNYLLQLKSLNVILRSESHFVSYLNLFTKKSFSKNTGLFIALILHMCTL